MGDEKTQKVNQGGPGGGMGLNELNHQTQKAGLLKEIKEGRPL